MSQSVQLTGPQERAAVTRIKENLSLLSGAGCGKTLVLARRFTELLLASKGQENPLQRLVALTFTDKAAMEMSQRVRRMLGEFAQGAKGEDRRRLLGWIEELPEARVSTIHSFCSSVLRSHAIQAGIDPDFAVCPDELVTATMVAEAADEAVLSAIQEQRPDAAEILTRMPYGSLCEHVRRLVDDRTDFRPADHADAADILSRWEQLLIEQREAAWNRLSGDAELRAKLDGIAAIRCADPGDKLAVFRDAVLPPLRGILDTPAARTPEAFAELPKSAGNAGSAKAWGTKDVMLSVRKALREVLAAVGEYALFAEHLGDLDEQAAAAIATLVRLADDANRRYAAAKRRMGLLDFTDLLACTHELLSGNPDVRRDLMERFDQLLIDEAQDTDSLQIRLLLLLAFGQERPESLPDGRLFLVGDAKQSIYRFRGAQVEVFQGLCERIGRGKQENLDTSYRTHAAGVALVNHVFARLMGEDYVPIKAKRQNVPPHPSVQVLLAAMPEDEGRISARDACQGQAAVTADRIRRMLDEGERLVWDDHAGNWRSVQPRDIAILFGRMTNSLDYERELARRDIPYYVVAGTGFFKQQEVYDVLNALRVIDNPFDDVSLFGVLRSSLLGLDDNVLMHVAERFDPPYFPHLAVRPRAHRRAGAASKGASPRIDLPDLTDEARRTLEFAVGAIGALHARKDALSIDAIIERLLEATGYEAALLCQFQGKRMLGNVRRLVEQARTASEGGLALADFIAQTDELVINELRYEQAAVAGEAENVVRLMTIHKAKGLEFPVVFVPDLNAGRKGHKGALLMRNDWGLTLKLQADDQADEEEGSQEPQAESPLSDRLARLLENEDLRKEDIRRLYVATTRHQDYLVLVGANWRKQDGAIRERGSYLDLLDSVLGISAAIDAGQDTVPYGDKGFVASVLVCPPAPPPAGKRRGSVGQKLLGGASGPSQLAEAILSVSPRCPAPALLGPLPPGVAQVEIAVVALSDFEHCPMLYRWRYELRTPTGEVLSPAAPRARSGSDGPTASKAEAETDGQRGSGGARAGPGRGERDPLAMGTLFHKCMELLDFSKPQPASALLAQAAAELEMDEEGITGAAGQLQGMIDTFRGHDLSMRIGRAKSAYRELDFVMELTGARIRGQIDLIYQDPGGAWHIVDYKSDHVDEASLAEHAGRYELQMLLYASAAWKHFGSHPADATLDCLRPGASHVFPVTPETLAVARQRVEKLTTDLITARRTGNFPRNTGGACRFCPYGPLCLRK
jgi:ATP-dependent helicase/nuclease subunit A